MAFVIYSQNKYPSWPDKGCFLAITHAHYCSMHDMYCKPHVDSDTSSLFRVHLVCLWSFLMKVQSFTLRYGLRLKEKI